MAWSLVAHTKQHGATTSAIDTTGADLLVIAVTSYSVTPVTVSDSKSNTWSPLTERANGNNHHRLFYCQGGTVGSAHTFSTNANFYSIIVAAFSGSTASPLDQTTGATASAQTIQPGSITPTVDNEPVVTSMGQGADLAGGGTDTWTVGSSYSISDFIDAANGSYDGAGIAWIAQGTAAATNPQWDSAHASQALTAIIASFKSAGGGGFTAKNRRTVGYRVGSRSYY